LPLPSSAADWDALDGDARISVATLTELLLGVRRAPAGHAI